MARVLKGSHSFTCTPRVQPLTEWTIPAFAFPAEAGTHLPTPEGWKAELALGGWLVTYWNKCPARGHGVREGGGVCGQDTWPVVDRTPTLYVHCSAICCVFVSAVKQESGQPVAVYPWHCLVPFLASSSSSSTPATAQHQQQQRRQIASTHPADTSPASTAGPRVIGLSWRFTDVSPGKSLSRKDVSRKKTLCLNFSW